MRTVPQRIEDLEKEIAELKQLLSQKTPDFSRLKIESSFGTTDLKITDDNRQDWYLLRFTPDGKVCRHVSVPKELGFEVDRRGALIIGEI